MLESLHDKDCQNVPPAREPQPENSVGPLHDTSIVRVRNGRKRLLGHGESCDGCYIQGDRAIRMCSRQRIAVQQVDGTTR
jgi:hypothetical protein